MGVSALLASQAANKFGDFVTGPFSGGCCCLSSCMGIAKWIVALFGILIIVGMILKFRRKQKRHDAANDAAIQRDRQEISSGHDLKDGDCFK